jgi:hypothetical protein
MCDDTPLPWEDFALSTDDKAGEAVPTDLANVPAACAPKGAGYAGDPDVEVLGDDMPDAAKV